MNPEPDRSGRLAVGLWSFIAGVLVGFLLHWGWTSSDPQIIAASPGVIVETIHDTVVRDRRVISVRDHPARVRVKAGPIAVHVDSTTHDTLAAPPFTALADTIIGRDTIEQRFDYPPPRLSVVVRQGPDSIVNRTQIVTVRMEVDRQQAWWEEPAKAILWLGVGYGIRTFTAPR